MLKLQEDESDKAQQRKSVKRRGIIFLIFIFVTSIVTIVTYKILARIWARRAQKLREQREAAAQPPNADSVGQMERPSINATPAADELMRPPVRDGENRV